MNFIGLVIMYLLIYLSVYTYLCDFVNLVIRLLFGISFTVMSWSYDLNYVLLQFPFQVYYTRQFVTSSVILQSVSSQLCLAVNMCLHVVPIIIIYICFSSINQLIHVIRCYMMVKFIHILTSLGEPTQL